jgi:hypothetical protein
VLPNDLQKLHFLILKVLMSWVRSILERIFF